MQYTDFQQAILRLKEQFPSLDWSPEEITVGGQTELIYHWPGTCREDIIICCHQSEFEREPFHRHDFFYFNYTYQGQYDSISCKYDRKITVCENELYAGQPFAGHALVSAFLIQIARQYGTQLSATPPDAPRRSILPVYEPAFRFCYPERTVRSVFLPSQLHFRCIEQRIWDSVFQTAPSHADGTGIGADEGNQSAVRADCFFGRIQQQQQLLQSLPGLLSCLTSGVSGPPQPLDRQPAPDRAFFLLKPGD